MSTRVPMEVQRQRKAAAMREWNARNRDADTEVYRSRQRRDRERKAKNRARTDAIKRERGCMDCGYNKHACALDFDHRPGEIKLFNVAALMSGVWARVEAEIAKCDVVCANCHRVRTFIGR